MIDSNLLTDLNIIGKVGGLGKCVDLPLEGQPCGFGCDCTIGFKCAVNPLCPKCRPICMKNEIVSSLNRYLNEACFDKCKDMMFNHLCKFKFHQRIGLLFERKNLLNFKLNRKIVRLIARKGIYATNIVNVRAARTVRRTFYAEIVTTFA